MTLLIEQIEIKPGYVYLLENLLLGGYKIGITTNPTQRFKSLKVGAKSKVLAYWKSPHYREIEKFLHAKFKEERIPQAEWFALSDDQIQEIIDKMNPCTELQFLDKDLKQGTSPTLIQFTEHLQEPLTIPKGFVIATAVMSAILLLLS